MRTKYTPTGDALEHLNGSGSKKKLYGYPHLNNSENSYYFDRNPQYGLHYNYYATVSGENPKATEDNIDQSFLEGGTMTAIDGAQITIAAGEFDPRRIAIQPQEVENVYGEIQGICPDGWHVPSQREWYEVLYQMTVG